MRHAASKRELKAGAASPPQKARTANLRLPPRDRQPAAEAKEAFKKKLHEQARKWIARKESIIRRTLKALDDDV